MDGHVAMVSARLRPDDEIARLNANGPPALPRSALPLPAPLARPSLACGHLPSASPIVTILPAAAHAGARARGARPRDAPRAPAAALVGPCVPGAAAGRSRVAAADNRPQVLPRAAAGPLAARELRRVRPALPVATPLPLPGGRHAGRALRTGGAARPPPAPPGMRANPIATPRLPPRGSGGATHSLPSRGRGAAGAWWRPCRTTAPNTA